MTVLDAATRAAYEQLLATSHQASVFHQPWWLDAVAGVDGWRLSALWRDPQTMRAAWPAVEARSGTRPVLVGAPLTPYLGPLFLPQATRERDVSEWVAATGELVDGFGPVRHLEARCHPSFDYWSPLAWKGFSQTTQYTWRLTDLADVDAAFARTRESVRRAVRKARKLGVNVEPGTLDEFLQLQKQTFSRQGQDDRMPSQKLVRRLDDAAGSRDARSILVARGPDGRAHAAAFFVHDAGATYYLMGGADTALRSSGGMSLVMWTAIEATAARGAIFDFEGSMLQPVERFFRSFGGNPSACSVVRWTPSRGFRWQRTIKRAVRGLAAR